MYGKIFASMFKGSLYGQWEAIVTFTVMIVLADQHGEVDMTPEALAASTSIPLDIIRKGIADLEAPDPKSRTPDEEGRRIVRVSEDRDWGWRITNYAHYRAMRSAEERREYMRQYQRKRRAASKPESTGASTPVNNVTQAVSSKQYAGSKKEEEAVAAAHESKFTDPLHRAAYLAYREVAAMPSGLDASLAALAGGMTTGHEVPWDRIGTALVEMRGGGAKFSSRALAAFVRGLQKTLPPATKPTDLAAERRAFERGEVF